MRSFSREQTDGFSDGDAPASSDMTRSLRNRLPGQRAIVELLSIHPGEHARSDWARIFGISPIGTESEAAFVGALGELRVGELLVELGASWTVLHAVMVGGEDMDINHLVIGPAGIFTITTRNHPGQSISVSGRSVLAGGMKLAHIRRVEHDLGRAERCLTLVLGAPVRVRALLVFVDPVVLELRTTPKDVQVLASSALVPWLTAQPQVLSDAETDRISAVAAQPETWGSTAALDEYAPAELDRLVRLVARSRSLRQLWFGAATILVLVSATVFVTLAIVGTFPGGAR